MKPQCGGLCGHGMLYDLPKFKVNRGIGVGSLGNGY